MTWITIDDERTFGFDADKLSRHAHLIGTTENRLSPNSTAAAFLGTPVLSFIEHLVLGDCQQQHPEVLSISHFVESAVSRAATEAVENRDDNIFFVGNTA